MRRYLPIIVVVLVVIIAVLWIQFGRRPAGPAVVPGQAAKAKPLAPQPDYLKVVDQFMGAWAKGDSAGVYAQLSDRMKQLIKEPDFAKQMAETKLSNPRTVAHTGIVDAAYVIERVDTPQSKGQTPVNGFSILLKQQNGQWKVALFVTEEKVAEKYTDLKLAPGKDKGYVVTYQDEKGQIATVNLQAL